ncbi:L-aspartate oxidase [Anaerosporobacter faecicola]|uniref:L-aspartate oxidase n=1 Tax=Anaerosporobacter faecicola TaxID=2718714 RepID=UPI00143A411E|nr:L-aspartate oxidase [Anaerosporobacter faecicola]
MTDKNADELRETYQVIIVGTGAAGLFTALSLPKEMQILMITKDAVENSDSYLAQGGISVLKNEEDFSSYFEDTMRAGHYENNEESVRVMIQSSRAIIEQLLTYGVVFDKNQDGSFAYTREGAHSTYRILRHDDVTGKEITSKLIAQVKKRSNIQVLEYTTMIDLLSDESCKGIVIETSTGETKNVYSNAVVLATGGIGGLFQNSTNFPHITGDSFAIALRHQVELQDIHYIQIHPTALYSKKKGRRFLISESLRGEGGVLKNHKGERFVDELLPRDVVTAAIKEEMEKEGTDHVFLDISHLEAEKTIKRFPNIYQRCLEEGYDFTKEAIPVAPAQHYLMGGIKVDTKGATTLPHLYAVGETACNGVHGANRLASNSLLESLVFASRAAEQIVKEDVLQHQEDMQQQIAVASSVLDDDSKRVELFRQLIWKEIKREDEKFYVRWCNNAN